MAAMANPISTETAAFLVSMLPASLVPTTRTTRYQIRPMPPPTLPNSSRIKRQDGEALESDEGLGPTRRLEEPGGGEPGGEPEDQPGHHSGNHILEEARKGKDLDRPSEQQRAHIGDRRHESHENGGIGG